MELTHIIFDWGDTLMVDFPEKPGPMADWDIVKVIPNVVEVLEILKDKYTLVVATNAGASDTALMRKALIRGKIEHFFSYFFSSKDLGYSKPNVKFFLEICNQLNVFSENCVFVGNDYFKDIEGAAKAGMFPIFFNHIDRKGDLSAARSVIHKIDQLPELLLTEKGV